MKCIAKCADGTRISVPSCCSEYMHYFKSLQDAYDDEEFFKVEGSQTECEEVGRPPALGSLMPIKTFQYNDKETGKSVRVRFTCSQINNRCGEQ